MTDEDVRELLHLIDTFVTGADQSRALADEIEGLVVECFAGEAWFDDVSLALAQYSPGGGSHYYDESALSAVLAEPSRSLRERGNENSYRRETT